jgi:purine-nucleoside phosphorylase
MTYFDQVTEAAEWLRGRGFGGAEVAIVLGSGLGDFGETLQDSFTAPYAEIPHWPASGVVGHAGKLVGGTVHGRRVLALSGRVHVYEGHDLKTATFGIRALGRLGVPRLILTNAAGGINPACAQGSLMIIDDHINFMGGNPLVGPNDPRLGQRFIDMSEVYSARMRATADGVAAAMGLPLQHGVYLALSGPSFETPAEIRAFRTWGADAVGMSTVPEAIVARHMGMEVLGISCITNAAAGVLPQAINHEEVMEVGRRVRKQFGALLEGIIERL